MDIERLQWRLLRGYLVTFLVPVFFVLAASIFFRLPAHTLSLVLGFSLGSIVGCTLLVSLTVRHDTWGKIAVLIEPDSLTTAAYPVKSEILWEAVPRIAEDAQGFYFYLNPLQVVMVPRRVFRSVEEAKGFWALTTEYYQRAKGATVVTEKMQSER